MRNIVNSAYLYILPIPVHDMLQRGTSRSRDDNIARTRSFDLFGAAVCLCVYVDWTMEEIKAITFFTVITDSNVFRNKDWP